MFESIRGWMWERPTPTKEWIESCEKIDNAIKYTTTRRMVTIPSEVIEELLSLISAVQAPKVLHDLEAKQNRIIAARAKRNN